MPLLREAAQHEKNWDSYDADPTAKEAIKTPGQGVGGVQSLGPFHA